MNNAEPTVAQEVEDRKAQAARLEALFRLRPLEDIEPDELRRITPHYQQRISCNLRKTMRVVNVPRFREDADGTKHRLDGAYRFEPHEPLGRDAGSIVAAGWSTPHSRPFEQPFELKP